MAEETTQGTEPVEGEPEGAPETASVEGTQSADGQPAAVEGATDGGHSDDLIFDPQEYQRLTADLPDNLKGQAEALRKSLQGAFTKKTQSIAEQRKKIEAYDAFTQNPVQALEQFARQYGYKLEKPGETNKGDGGEKWNPEAGDPNSWKDVIGYMKEALMSELGGTLNPIVEQFSSMKKQTIEQQLTEIDPSWQKYEDDMMSTLKEHPTLAKDPSKLYRLSVPADVLESRATQRALAKMEAKTKSAQVSGPSSTTKKITGGLPEGKMTFQQAVDAARKKLSEDGIAAP